MFINGTPNILFNNKKFYQLNKLELTIKYCFIYIYIYMCVCELKIKKIYE